MDVISKGESCQRCTGYSILCFEPIRSLQGSQGDKLSGDRSKEESQGQP